MNISTQKRLRAKEPNLQPSYHHHHWNKQKSAIQTHNTGIHNETFMMGHSPTLWKEIIYFYFCPTFWSQTHIRFLTLSIVRDNKYWRGKVHFQTVPPPLISVKSRPVCSVRFVERMAFFTFDRLDFTPARWDQAGEDTAEADWVSINRI